MKAMDVVNPLCAGMDVHKDTVVACVRRVEPDGRESTEVRTFGTKTADLLALGDWLVERGVKVAAMESTGVYWKPVWNLLEGRLELMLVNPRDVKQVPGRKTDVKDGRWISRLLCCGLLNPSFVPPQPQRDLRDLTRTRASLLADRARLANRIQKTLEDANIKLGSVASDVLGASGRDMLRAMIAGNSSPEEMAELARFRMRSKIPQLTEALRGGVREHHRFMLKLLLEQVEQLEKAVQSLEQRIEQVMSPLERRAVELLDGIPGLNRHAAAAVAAEIGGDMDRFPTAGHLSAWAGLAPGNNRSAGKRLSGKMPEGNRWLKAVLNQSAWAASRKKNSYFAAQHRRIAARRGLKRATMAVAHSLLCICWHLIKHGQCYQDLGGDYFERRNADRIKGQLVGRLERMGYTVTITEKPAA